MLPKLSAKGPEKLMNLKLFPKQLLSCFFRIQKRQKAQASGLVTREEG